MLVYERLYAGSDITQWLCANGSSCLSVHCIRECATCREQATSYVHVRTYDTNIRSSVWINVNNKDPPPGQRAFLKTNTKTCLLQPPAPLPLAPHETLGLGLEAPGEHAARDNEDGYLKD